MTPSPALISSDLTLEEAAQEMRDLKCGILPVGTEEALEGILTDRDIVVRAVARGRDITREKVRDYLTPVVHACRTDDTLERAADYMRTRSVSRLVVRNNNGKVCGILSFGAILRKKGDSAEITRLIKHATTDCSLV